MRDRVLVIDDDAMLVRFLRRGLTQAGNEVHTAMAAQQARRLAGQGATGMLATLPRCATIWLVTISSLGAVVLAFCFRQAPAVIAALRGQPNLLRMVPFLLVAAIAFGIRPVRLGPGTKIHLGAAPLFCAAVLLSPALAGAIAYISALTHNLLLRRRPWNACYNAAQHLFTTAGAGLVYRLVLAAMPGASGTAAALVAAGCAYFLVSTVLAATMAALAQTRSWAATLGTTWRTVWSHYGTLLTLGWVGTLVATAAFWALPLLAVPIAIAYRLDHTLGDLLETRRRLAEALERQRQFVGDVAHELGAPLTSVAGNAAVLLAEPTLPPALLESVEDIFAEASRTARLLSDLLLLSTIEEGETLTPTAVSLRGVAEHALQLSRTAAVVQDITLELRAPVDGWVSGSRELLEQLVVNLIANAVQHSPPGGSVTVTLASRDGWLANAVTDSGVGIPAGELERVFQRHFRAGKAESRALGGAGLGLAIARRIAEVHGGQLTASSDVGSGSCFTLLLRPVLPPRATLTGNHAAP